MVDEIRRQGGYKPGADPLAALLENATGGGAVNGEPADTTAHPAIETEQRS